MHVRIAWEILHHQKKENPEKSASTPNFTKTVTAAASTPDLHRPPSHIFQSSTVLQRPPELSTSFPQGLPRPYETSGIPSGFLTGPASHLGMNHSLSLNFKSVKLIIVNKYDN